MTRLLFSLVLGTLALTATPDVKTPDLHTEAPNNLTACANTPVLHTAAPNNLTACANTPDLHTEAPNNLTACANTPVLHTTADQTVSVRSFGAKPDDGKDDTKALR